MTTRDDVRAVVEGTRPRDQYGRCAGLTDEVTAALTGGSRKWYDSATAAREQSGWLNPDWRACPAGGIHFWSYTGTAWDGSYGDWGHVTIDIDGGGTATLSATGYAYEYWGVNAGLISVVAQSARRGMTYLGWARRYGAAAPLTIGAAPASTSRSSTPPPTPPQEEDDMPGIRMHFLRKSDGNQAYIVETETGFYIPNADRLAALVKAYSINLSGLVTVNEYDWEAITNAKAESLAGYAAAVRGVTTGPDAAQIAAAIAGQLQDAVTAVPAAEATQIAAAVEARLRDEFAAIPGAVAEEQAERLASK